MNCVRYRYSLTKFDICREEVEIGEERPTDYSLRFQESEDPELLARQVYKFDV
jgi:hypothetical protein